MDIELGILSKEIILVLLICRDLKLNFKEAKKLYLGNDKVFWHYLFYLFPSIKMTEDRLSRLSKLSSSIYNKLMNDSVQILPKDNSHYEFVRLHIKDRFENNGILYDFKDFISYIKYSKTGYIKHKLYINILLNSGEYLHNVCEYDLEYHKENIHKVVIGQEDNTEDKLIFTRTSEYAFITKDKEEVSSFRILPVLKSSDKISIYKQEDLISLSKNDNIVTNKDLYLHCKINIDLNIKCKNIVSEYDLVLGNLEANSLTVKNITANNIKATTIQAENINARSIEVLNNIKANNIKYYAICFAYNDINCKSIQGTRNNSKHFSLDGGIKING